MTISPFSPPLLPTGWIVPETISSRSPSSAEGFLNGLSRRGWYVVRPTVSLPDVPDNADLVVLDSDREILPREQMVFVIETAARLHKPLLLTGDPDIVATYEEIAGKPVSPLHGGRLRDWWGPERMDEELIRNTPSDAVTRVTVGLRWTMVETERSTGLAAMPLLHTGAEVAPSDTSSLATGTGTNLHELAAGLRHGAGIERSIACAAVNAGIPRPAELSEQDGLLEDRVQVDGRTVIVGRFPRLEEKRPNAIVLERNPGPDDYPAEAAPYVIPGAAELICTASAWCNASLPPLLRLACGSRIALVGPGTPLSPLLHEYGIAKLAGFIVENVDAVREVIAAGRGVKDFKAHGRQVLLAAPPSPPA